MMKVDQIVEAYAAAFEPGGSGSAINYLRHRVLEYTSAGSKF